MVNVSVNNKGGVHVYSLALLFLDFVPLINCLIIFVFPMLNVLFLEGGRHTVT